MHLFSTVLVVVKRSPDCTHHSVNELRRSGYVEKWCAKPFMLPQGAVQSLINWFKSPLKVESNGS